ncbi:MAG: hypothetical protein WAX33_03905 [Rectinemataceae bacterium]
MPEALADLGDTMRAIIIASTSENALTKAISRMRLLGHSKSEILTTFIKYGAAEPEFISELIKSIIPSCSGKSTYQKQLDHLLAYPGRFMKKNDAIAEQVIRGIFKKLYVLPPDAMGALSSSQRNLSELSSLSALATNHKLHKIFNDDEITIKKTTILDCGRLFTECLGVIEGHNTVSLASHTSMLKSHNLIANAGSCGDLSLNYSHTLYTHKTIKDLSFRNALGFQSISTIYFLDFSYNKVFSLKNFMDYFSLPKSPSVRRINGFIYSGIIKRLKNNNFKVIKNLTYNDLAKLSLYFHTFNSSTKLKEKHLQERQAYDNAPLSREAFQDSMLQDFNKKQEEVKMQTKKEDFFAGDVEDDFDSEAILVDIDNYHFDAEKMAENKSYFNKRGFISLHNEELYDLKDAIYAVKAYRAINE